MPTRMTTSCQMMLSALGRSRAERAPHLNVKGVAHTAAHVLGRIDAVRQRHQAEEAPDDDELGVAGSSRE